MFRKQDAVQIAQVQKIKVAEDNKFECLELTSEFTVATSDRRILRWNCPPSQVLNLSETLDTTILYKISYLESHVDEHGRQWIKDVVFLEN